MTQDPDRSKPKRRWFRYSVRTLLLVMLLAGCGFGWLGSKLAQGRRQKAVIVWIDKLGGRVEFEAAKDTRW